jgi:uncharacterized Tic20 family protein
MAKCCRRATITHKGELREENQVCRPTKVVMGAQEDGRVVMSAQDERIWSVLAHLSMFLNLVTGFLGPVVALIIYVVYKDRSQKVAFNALQSRWYRIG